MDHQILNNRGIGDPAGCGVVPVEGDILGCGRNLSDLRNDRVEPLDMPNTNNNPIRNLLYQLLCLGSSGADRFFY